MYLYVCTYVWCLRMYVCTISTYTSPPITRLNNSLLKVSADFFERKKGGDGKMALEVKVSLVRPDYKFCDYNSYDYKFYDY